MKSTIISLAAALAILATGCTKKEELETCMGSCTTVVGRLITANGQQPLANTPVEVRWHYGQAYQPKSTLKAQATTDANGNYRLSFFIKDEELTDGYFSVRYTPNKSQYYTIGEDSQVLNNARRDTTFTLPAYLIPRKAYVRLVITNPADVARYAFMSDFNTTYGLSTTFSRKIQGGGPVVFWDGLPIENPLPIAGDQPILVKGYKKKNSLTEYTTDSLFIPAGSTYTYSVTF
ncbi:hypothetical protein [Hymenobacter pini]|uniref:hypothetical protein n=1 Tax=Hymenobacter pini TaxID=2880879 RepID=UPI001CF3FE8C|nr:hypothetical protein [Hymenobacter pini]MCA8829388.1 hypothetical protein [Hymenobacter pini]